MILNIRNVELDELVDFLCCNIEIFFVILHFILWEVLFVDFAACMVGSGTAFNTLKKRFEI